MIKKMIIHRRGQKEKEKTKKTKNQKKPPIWKNQTCQPFYGVTLEPSTVIYILFGVFIVFKRHWLLYSYKEKENPTQTQNKNKMPKVPWNTIKHYKR